MASAPLFAQRPRRWSLQRLLVALAMTQVTTVRAFSLLSGDAMSSRLSSSQLPPQRRSRQQQPLHVSLGPLHYRDRDTAEEGLTSLTTVSRTATTTVYGNLASSIAAHMDELAKGLRNVSASHLPQIDFGAIQLPLLQSVCASQLVALAVACAVATILSPQLSMWLFSSSSAPPMAWRTLEGVLAALPLIGMTTHVEQSDERWASHVNFSVSNTVISLFGRRRRRTDSNNILRSQLASQGDDTLAAGSKTTMTTMGHVAVAGGLLAGVSAISEEVIFRGLLPNLFLSVAAAVLSQLSLSIHPGAAVLLWLGCAVVLPAASYGAGQHRPTSSRAENDAFCMLATLQGLWYGCFSILTGGDLVPLIVAHALYEGHVLTEAWMHINDQMDYTEDVCNSSAPGSNYDQDVAELEHLRHEAGNSLITSETLAVCRRFFYAFDSDHRGALSLSDVQRAVTCAFMQEGQLPGTTNNRDPPTTTSSIRHVPTPNQVQEAFDYFIEARTRQQQRPGKYHGDAAFEEEEHEPRLRVWEFLQLLFALNSKAWQGQLSCS